MIFLEQGKENFPLSIVTKVSVSQFKVEKHLFKFEASEPELSSWILGTGCVCLRERDRDRDRELSKLISSLGNMEFRVL